jgi:acetyltransferase (GNAT) family protein
MAPRARARDGRGVAYRYLTVGEDGLEPELRDGLATLLSTTLDDGEAYRDYAWRTLRPAFRVVALAGDEPVGQASAFWVPCQPPTMLLGVGDVAVAPEHRRRQVARTVCTIATEEGWRLHASAILVKTRPLRTVFGELGYERVTNGQFFYLEGGQRTAHPDWMAAIRQRLPLAIRLEEGDF